MISTNYFDLVDIHKLTHCQIGVAQLCIARCFMTIQQHMAVRVVQCNVSTLTGCKNSIARTRVFLLTGMIQLSSDQPLAAAAPPKKYMLMIQLPCHMALVLKQVMRCMMQC